MVGKGSKTIILIVVCFLLMCDTTPLNASYDPLNNASLKTDAVYLQINSTQTFTITKGAYTRYRISLNEALNVSIMINTSVDMQFSTPWYLKNFNGEIKAPGSLFEFYLNPNTNNVFDILSSADTDFTMTVMGYKVKDIFNRNSTNAYAINLDVPTTDVLNFTDTSYENDWYQFELLDNQSIRVLADSYSSELIIDLYSYNMTLLDTSHLAAFNKRLDSSILGTYSNSVYYLKISIPNQLSYNDIPLLYTIRIDTALSNKYLYESQYTSYENDSQMGIIYYGKKTITIYGSVLNSSELVVPFDAWDQGSFETQFITWPEYAATYSISGTTIINQTESIIGYHPVGQITYLFNTNITATDFILTITQELGDYEEIPQMKYGYANITERVNPYNFNLNYPQDVDTYAYYPSQIGNLTLQIKTSDQIKVSLYYKNGTQFNSTIITGENEWVSFQFDLISESIGIRIEHTNDNELLTYYSIQIGFVEQYGPYTPILSSSHSKTKKGPFMTMTMGILFLVPILQFKKKLRGITSFDFHSK